MRLQPCQTVLCLHGKHRVLAAEAVLPVHDQWWTLAFYDDGESAGDGDRLSAACYRHAGGRPPVTDRAIRERVPILRRRRIPIYRMAQKAEDQQAVKMWLARLSASKKRNLIQVEKADHGRLIEALDTFIPFADLWQEFLIAPNGSNLLLSNTYPNVINVTFRWTRHGITSATRLSLAMLRDFIKLPGL